MWVDPRCGIFNVEELIEEYERLRAVDTNRPAP